jgi:hypothetical protein
MKRSTRGKPAQKSAHSILDHEVPGLADRLRALPPNAKDSVISEASLFVAGTMTELGAETLLVLQTLRTRGRLTLEQAEHALLLSEATDDWYFQLQAEGAPQEEWERAFSEARLLRGIAVGYDASKEEDVSDSICELMKAQDAPEELIQLVLSQVGR